MRLKSCSAGKTCSWSLKVKAIDRLLWKSKVARQLLHVSLKYQGWERKVDVQLPHTSSAPSFQEMFYLQI